MPAPYALDTTASNPANYIADEFHATDESFFKSYYFIIPEFGPFYADDFTVVLNTAPTPTTLTLNTDYKFILPYMAGKRNTNKDVYGGIVLHNPPLQTVLTLNYRTVGSDKVADRIYVLNKIIDHPYNLQSTTFEMVTDHPDIFLPVPQYNDYPSTKGYLEVNQKLYGVRDALAQGYTALAQSLRNVFRSKYKYNNRPTNYNDYVNLSGDTLDVNLKLSTDPVATNHAFRISSMQTSLDAIDNQISSISLSGKLNRNTPTATGPLYTDAPISSANPYGAVTKEFVDNLSSSMTSGSKINVGSIALFPSTASIQKFIKADGRVVDQLAYASLYSVIGNTYNRKETIGHGTPWKNREQYDINPNTILYPKLDQTLTNIPITSYSTNLDNGKAFIVADQIYVICSTYDNTNTNPSTLKIYKANYDTNQVITGFTLHQTVPFDTVKFTDYPIFYQMHVITAFNKVYFFMNTNVKFYCFSYDIDTGNTLSNYVEYPIDMFTAYYRHDIIDVFLVNRKIYLVINNSDSKMINIYSLTIDPVDNTLPGPVNIDKMLPVAASSDTYSPYYSDFISWVYDKKLYLAYTYKKSTTIFTMDINPDDSLSEPLFLQNIPYLFRSGMYVDVAKYYITFTGYMSKYPDAPEFNTITYYVNADRTLVENPVLNLSINSTLITNSYVNSSLSNIYYKESPLAIIRHYKNEYIFSFGTNKYLKRREHLFSFNIDYSLYQNEPYDFTQGGKFYLPYLENEKYRSLGLSYFICHTTDSL